ncbi:MAG: DUF2474 domain-containing protein [Cypionkella sp.]
MQRWLWFLALYVGGIVVIGAIAMLIRAALIP